MDEHFTIGQVAERSGLPIKTIRFYEDQGVVPAPPRSSNGYRRYTPIDVRRLRLVRLGRLLGLGLPEVKALVDQAFASECSDFAEAFLARIAEQQAEIDRRIAELEALKVELRTLTAHVEHSIEELRPGQRVAGCDFCPILDPDIPAAGTPAEAAR